MVCVCVEREGEQRETLWSMSILDLKFSFSYDQQGLILSSFYMGYIALMLFGGWLSTKLGNPLAESLEVPFFSEVNSNYL